MGTIFCPNKTISGFIAFVEFQINPLQRISSCFKFFCYFRCRRCFFDGDQKLATFLLFHLPLLILLCLNLFFFVVTVTKLKSTWDLGKSYNMNTSSKVLQIRLVRSKNRNRLMGNGLA